MNKSLLDSKWLHVDLCVYLVVVDLAQNILRFAKTGIEFLTAFNVNVYIGELLLGIYMYSGTNNYSISASDCESDIA